VVADEQRLVGNGMNFDELVVENADIHIERNHEGAIYISITPAHGVGYFLLDVEAIKRNHLWVGVTQKPNEWEGVET